MGDDMEKEDRKIRSLWDVDWFHRKPHAISGRATRKETEGESMREDRIVKKKTERRFTVLRPDRNT